MACFVFLFWWEWRFTKFSKENVFLHKLMLILQSLQVSTKYFCSFFFFLKNYCERRTDLVIFHILEHILKIHISFQEDSSLDYIWIAYLSSLFFSIIKNNFLFLTFDLEINIFNLNDSWSLNDFILNVLIISY